MTIQDMKSELIANGHTVESTNTKGNYIVTNTRLETYQTVRFTNATKISPPYIKVRKYDEIDGRDFYLNTTLAGYLKRY